MRITTEITTAETITVGQVIYNPEFPALNRCVEVNEIRTPRPGCFVFVDHYTGDVVTAYTGQALTRIDTEY